MSTSIQTAYRRSRPQLRWLPAGIASVALLAAFALRFGPPPVVLPEVAAESPLPGSVEAALPRPAYRMAAGDPSPTGRKPRLGWTPERQAVWNRMRRDGHPLWKALKSAAEANPPKYGARGPWATLVYQITGEADYARKAWEQIDASLDPAWKPADGRNYTRQDLITLAWMYDWLYPALTPPQRDRLVAKLNQLADLTLDRVAGTPWGTRVVDSDETVGHYFGLALVDLATAPDNPRAGSFLKATWKDSEAGSMPVGGLDATGSGLRTGMRNAIREYAEMARGGQWIESSEYNLNTLKLLLLGAECTRTATSSDAFPEITRLTQEAALSQIYELTSDLESAFQWGDTEKPRDLNLYHRVPLMGMLSGLTKGDPKVGPLAQGVTKRLVDSALAKGVTPNWYFYLFYDPYAPAADWREALPAGRFALGQGLLFFHDGWQRDDALFGAHMLPLTPYVDHQVSYFGDFQLYRKGEWAITHPLDYSGPSHLGEAVNGMLFAGLGSMREWRGAVAQEFGPNDSYAYLCGTNGGQHYDPSYYDPPATYLHEWTRSLVYLSSPGRRSSTVVVYDRTHTEDPRALPRLARYRADQGAAINRAPALRQWLIHPTARPAAGADDVTWPTPSGKQDVRLSTLLPRDSRKTVTDLDEAWPDKWP
ncbi:MAG: agaA, partial [Armatimonadetes bacterium]|nr:agaA [Armatimonadota bacterium]